jgi:hypothetical protein
VSPRIEGEGRAASSSGRMALREVQHRAILIVADGEDSDEAHTDFKRFIGACCRDS